MYSEFIITISKIDQYERLETDKTWNAPTAMKKRFPDGSVLEKIFRIVRIVAP